MVVQSSPVGLRQKEIKTEWPVISGLTAGTQKQEDRVTSLVEEENLINEKDRVKIK